MAKLGREQRARKVREIYLSLPDTEETPTWGSPHFRVAGKIFGGLGDADRTTISMKLEMEHADAMVQSDRRFSRAPYVGHKGWVTVDVTDVEDWEEIRLLVNESYRLIAPKRTLAKLAAPAAEREPVRAAKKLATKAARAPTTRKRAAPAKPSAPTKRKSAAKQSKKAR